jgi:3-isopropylmalate dehydrogenase
MIKVRKRKILLLPGDGIGPEVIGEVKKIIQWFNDKKSLDFEIDEDLAGDVHMINMELQLQMKFFIKL